MNRDPLPESAEATAEYDAKLLAAGEAVEGDEARSTFAQTVSIINTFGGNTGDGYDRTGTSSVYSAMAKPANSRET